MEIICPICKEKLIKDDKRYYCSNRHSFDISKEGYVNLYLKKAIDSGDSKESINARHSFLNKNYYLFLKEKMNEIITDLDITSLCDLACGEGYYTKDLKVEHKTGIDLSKKGLKIASKNDPSTTYILSSIFHTPIEDKSVDMAITCFAPIAKEEIKRILKDSGYFLLINPHADHLYELKKVIYENPYENIDDDIDIDGLKLINKEVISNKFTLEKEDLYNLFKMTPYFYKTSKEDKDKLDNIDSLEITFSFNVYLYQKIQ